LWSFGNNQRSYLYGEDIEAIKKLGHDVVVNRCDVAANLFGVSLDAIESPTVNERRLKFCKERKRITKKMNLLEHLTRLQHLEHLEHLERLPTHGLITSNKSYEQLDLSKYDKDKTVIYLDPPYQNCDATISKSQYMKDYIENKCNIDHFSSLGFTVYLSEYKNPNPELWQEVLNIEKRVTMSTTNNKLKKIERLFKNK
jgi:site-specific DNA-adenine methylase